MTYEQLSAICCESIHWCDINGRKAKRWLFGQDACKAIHEYPGPIIQMKLTDPDYGRSEFMGIEFEAAAGNGVALIHE